jgi:hypothetical protein
MGLPGDRLMSLDEAEAIVADDLQVHNIFGAFDLDDFDGTANWISLELGLPPKIVSDAIQAMYIVGWIEKVEGKLKKKSKSAIIHLEPEKARVVGRTLFRQLLAGLLETQTIFRVKTRVFASNLQLMTEYYQGIDELTDEIIKKSAASRCDRLCNTGTVLFDDLDRNGSPQ